MMLVPTWKLMSEECRLYHSISQYSSCKSYMFLVSDMIRSFAAKCSHFPLSQPYGFLDTCSRFVVIFNSSDFSQIAIWKTTSGQKNMVQSFLVAPLEDILNVTRKWNDIESQLTHIWLILLPDAVASLWKRNNIRWTLGGQVGIKLVSPAKKKKMMNLHPKIQNPLA